MGELPAQAAREGLTGVIFNIQRYSLNDGPGIRTVVFFKGCPLRCPWCCNPESIDPSPRLSFSEQKCLGDGRCVEVCPSGARTASGYDEKKCTLCGKCVEACPSGALELIGKRMSVPEALREAEKDRQFYESSGGGMTLSGGEILLQRGFAVALLEALRGRYLHSAIETTGYAKWEHLQEVVDAADLVLYDLKHMDSAVHEKYTGRPNGLILENARRVAGRGKLMIFRVPLIGGVNADAANVEAVAIFANESGVKEVHLLPYHRLGEAKYRKLGKKYDLEASTPDDETVRRLSGILESRGLVVKIGG